MVIHTSASETNRHQGAVASANINKKHIYSTIKKHLPSTNNSGLKTNKEHRPNKCVNADSLPHHSFVANATSLMALQPAGYAKR